MKGVRQNVRRSRLVSLKLGRVCQQLVTKKLLPFLDKPKEEKKHATLTLCLCHNRHTTKQLKAPTLLWVSQPFQHEFYLARIFSFIREVYPSLLI